MEYGLIRHEMVCTSCEITMALKETKDNLDGYEWRCFNKNCSKYKHTSSIRKYSFLENFKLKTKQILKIVMYWSQGMQQVDILKNVKVSRQCLSRLRSKLLQVIKDHFLANPIKLGGPGSVVHVDETMINHKIKAHRGRAPVQQTWLLCIVDTSTTPSIGFATIIENKSSNTLIPIISSVVKSGSIIHSDELKSYIKLKDINGYIHKSVCHKYEFIDKITGVHTQNVESYNNKLKLGIKKMKGLTKIGRLNFLSEFMFLDMYKSESFSKILELLK